MRIHDINIDLHTFMYSLAKALSGDPLTENGIYNYGWLYLYKQLTDESFDINLLYSLINQIEKNME